MPPSLRRLSLANNQLGGAVSARFISEVRKLPLSHLDLSNNDLICPPQGGLDWIFRSNLTYLNLASNQFQCEIATIDPIRGAFTTIQGLELQNNEFYGKILDSSFPNLVSLNIANNKFDGNYQAINFPALTQLNISYNRFSFHVSALDSARYLIWLDASSNFLHGTFSPHGWPNMIIADLRNNSFEDQPRLSDIGALFVDFKLQVFKFGQNPKIVPFDKLELNASGLRRLAQNSPSSDFSGGVCYELGFPKQPNGTTFSFDEGLFGYAQCDCDTRHFGLPPFKCYICPSSASIRDCSGQQLTVPEGMFSILVPTANSSLDLPRLQHQDDYQIESESCIYNTFQALTQRTNCQGLKITASMLAANDSVTPVELLATQCREGSEGRLCSRCACDPSGASKCWFSKGATCKLCSFTMSPRRSTALVICIFLVIVAVLSTIMFLALRSKRTLKLSRYVHLRLPLVAILDS